MTYDVVIIGSGPAGLSAGIYGKRAGLSTLIVDRSPMCGGQVTSTYEVDNYPGLPKVTGMELADKFKAHATEQEVEFLVSNITEIEDKGDVKVLHTNKDDIEAKSVIIATGARHRTLGVPGESEHAGMGVSYCATCDGAFFRNKDVAVVGGGDVALEDALFLARTSNKVYLIHRRDAFRGAKVLENQVRATENIELVLDSVVEEVLGDGMVEKVAILNKKTGEKSELNVNGVFMAVGILPNTEGLAGLPNTNEAGYIEAGEDGVTSIPGVFAAGDVRTKQLRQVITACSDGANCITSASRYLENVK
jgi:thioredoxin reductase (NADPH)